MSSKQQKKRKKIKKENKKENKKKIEEGRMEEKKKDEKKKIKREQEEKENKEKERKEKERKAKEEEKKTEKKRIRKKKNEKEIKVPFIIPFYEKIKKIITPQIKKTRASKITSLAKEAKEIPVLKSNLDEVREAVRQIQTLPDGSKENAKRFDNIDSNLILQELKLSEDEKEEAKKIFTNLPTSPISEPKKEFKEKEVNVNLEDFRKRLSEEVNRINEKRMKDITNLEQYGFRVRKWREKKKKMKKKNEKDHIAKEEKRMYSISFSIIILCFILLLFINIKEPYPKDSPTGYAVLNEDNEEETNVIRNITEKQVLDAILQAEKDMEEMIGAGFNVQWVDDTLIEAKKYFKGNYTALL